MCAKNSRTIARPPRWGRRPRRGASSSAKASSAARAIESTTIPRRPTAKGPRRRAAAELMALAAILGCAASVEVARAVALRFLRAVALQAVEVLDLVFFDRRRFAIEYDPAPAQAHEPREELARQVEVVQADEQGEAALGADVTQERDRVARAGGIDRGHRLVGQDRPW